MTGLLPDNYPNNLDDECWVNARAVKWLFNRLNKQLSAACEEIECLKKWNSIEWNAITEWKQIEDVIDHFTDLYPRSHWGPAHIVIEDFNMYDHNIYSSIALIEGIMAHRSDNVVAPEVNDLLSKLEWYSEYEEAELIATHALLVNLFRIPESVRTLYHGDWMNR